MRVYPDTRTFSIPNFFQFPKFANWKKHPYNFHWQRGYLDLATAVRLVINEPPLLNLNILSQWKSYGCFFQFMTFAKAANWRAVSESHMDAFSNSWLLQKLQIGAPSVNLGVHHQIEHHKTCRNLLRSCELRFKKFYSLDPRWTPSPPTRASRAPSPRRSRTPSTSCRRSGS